jgi:hypothetical protein
LLRSFAFVKPDRSSLWCSIALLVGGSPRDAPLNDCISYNLKVMMPCCFRPLVCVHNLSTARSLGLDQLALQEQQSA